MTAPTHIKSFSASKVRPPSYPLKKPFPLVFRDQPIAIGFGRGSTELGVPTANVPINQTLSGLDTGVYYGWCKLKPQLHAPTVLESKLHNRTIEFNYGSDLQPSELTTLPMVMSIGWNPTYDDLKEKAAEVHIIHKFSNNFYGVHIDYVILGFLRPELEFIDLETLKREINEDIEITKSLLGQQDQLQLKSIL